MKNNYLVLLLVAAGAAVYFLFYKKQISSPTPMTSGSYFAGKPRVAASTNTLRSQQVQSGQAQNRTVNALGIVSSVASSIASILGKSSGGGGGFGGSSSPIGQSQAGSGFRNAAKAAGVGPADSHASSGFNSDAYKSLQNQSFTPGQSSDTTSGSNIDSGIPLDNTGNTVQSTDIPVSSSTDFNGSANDYANELGGSTPADASSTDGFGNAADSSSGYDFGGGQDIIDQYGS